ncbi:OmpA family protein [Taibaiella soli]|uniref:OmpA-like domain-containing protein n=1 Tax=Taibaiella soli TaxID=1649169 RepID=A0A2W2B2J9_9BACT|nr:OmpA family protein [Taibaiella soli]PZF74504.1 hypothetical protein DN068_02710 [Taibaiella soli]
MKSQLLQSIEALFTNESMLQMSEQTGEALPDLKKAMEHVTSAILRGFASKTSEGDSARTQLMDLARKANDNSWWKHVLHWFDDSNKAALGTDILKHLFGHQNMERLAQNIGHQNNITTASATKLLQWAAPLCLGMLGKHAAENNLDAGSFTASINSLNAEINAAPASLNVERALGKKNKDDGNRLLWFVLGTLLLVGIIFFCTKGCKYEAATNTTVPVVDSIASAPTQQPQMPAFKLDADSTLQYVFGDIIGKKLPNGTVMHIPNNSAEALLLSNIQDVLRNGLDTTPEGIKNGWINLYNVQFTKMLTYRKGAEEEIGNIAAILKAYPMIAIKIGGYSDATGTVAVNKKLSQERAQKVAADLGKAGVESQVSGTEGYGPEFPIGDNRTAEGRAQNKRVSCRITSIIR